MLRRQPKEKDRRRVSIPDDLRESLREANSLIKESKRDPDVRIDYGDAIQVGSLIGGRVGTAKHPFEFTYYADGNHKSNTRWHLALHPLEIDDIVDGCQTEITLYCCRTPDCDHKSSDPELLCDNDPYAGNIELPDTEEALKRVGVLGITQSSTRGEIIDLLGEPLECGGDEKHPNFGYIWPWIKYIRPECQLRFEFQKSGKLRMVSILDPNWKPGT